MVNIQLDQSQRFARGRLKWTLIIAVVGTSLTMIGRYALKVFVLKDNHWDPYEKGGYLVGAILVIAVFIYSLTLDSKAGLIERKDK